MDVLVRDAAMTTAIFGFFASAWFGWAQERPPEGRATWWLGGGSALGLLLAAFGGITAWIHWDTASVLSVEGGMDLYLTVLGVEFGVALLGVLVLLALKRGAYLAPWVCLVVGVHFFPLAPVLADPGLYLLAALLTVWPFLAVCLANRRGLAPSFTTGAGAGPVLLVFSLANAVLLSAAL
ncbi:hypothetical protein [Nocardiopsis tropica]|uniref:Prepilin type IV endopeptidase peptidase domain-containing protein n=1 Tax=Nocardiopsis tropica TaxID=109330 RepID=A0ABV1ZWS1_9ACTN|nr:hypothetical protein [Nocardiopsis tropica]